MINLIREFTPADMDKLFYLSCQALGLPKDFFEAANTTNLPCIQTEKHEDIFAPFFQPQDFFDKAINPNVVIGPDCKIHVLKEWKLKETKVMRVKIKREFDPKSTLVGTVINQNDTKYHIDWHNGTRSWEFKGVLEQVALPIKVGSKVKSTVIKAASRNVLKPACEDYIGYVRFRFKDQVVVEWDLSPNRVELVDVNVLEGLS